VFSDFLTFFFLPSIQSEEEKKKKKNLSICAAKEMASKSVTIFVVGYQGCGYFIRAARAAESVAKRNASVDYKVQEMSRPDFKSWVAQVSKDRGIKHSSSPLVFEGDDPKTSPIIGGCDDTLAYLTKYN
jgi:hypothetical protein